MTLIVEKQQQPPSRAEKTSCITHGWKQQDRPEGWPILCGKISPEKRKVKKELWSANSLLQLQTSLYFVQWSPHSLFMSFHWRRGEKCLIKPQKTQLFHLKDLPKEGFPRAWLKPVKQYELHWLRPQMLGHLVVLHNKIYGREVSWILQLVSCRSFILQPSNGNLVLAVSCSLAALGCCFTNSRHPVMSQCE